MFKSLFFKYILVFIVITLFCFSMLTAITVSVVSHYASDARAEIVENEAEAVSVYLESYMEGEADVVFSDYVRDNGSSIGSVVRAMAAGSDGITVLFVDSHGEVVFMADGGTYREIYGTTLNMDLLCRLEGGDVLSIDLIEGVFNEPHLSVAKKVEHNGFSVGSVVVCSSSFSMDELIQTMSKTVFMSCLWVIFAAVIAVYLITERIVSPLRDMSRAAKSFAEGDYSVRVPVRGKDEVANLAASFNNMAESIESSEKMRNTFMANVSHDLRTPMTTIAGFIDGILDGAIPKEKHEYYLGVIATEVRRLSRLVSRLLDISRLQAGDRKFTKKPFDICEMGRVILFSFEKKIDEKRLCVEFDCDDDNMYANADTDAIYQILYNICDNAVKFSRDGGTLRLSVHKTADGKKLTVEVYNEGSGIPKEDLPYVFERFYKGDKSRGLDKTGVGLGLFIAKTIVEAHHEKIWVESEQEKYCKFAFTLERVIPGKEDL